MLIVIQKVTELLLNDELAWRANTIPKIINANEFQKTSTVTTYSDIAEIQAVCRRFCPYWTGSICKEFIFFGKKGFYFDGNTVNFYKEGTALTVKTYDEKLNLSIQDLIKIPDTKKVLAYLKQQYEQIDIEKIVQNAD